MNMFDWPKRSRGDIQEFFCTGGVWQTWTKPRGVDMVFMLVLGGGASGGGGFSAGNGNPRGGGGGGGSSGCCRLSVPSCLLPDTLYIQVGVGGASVGAGTLGNSGNNSYVSILPSTDTSAILAVSNNIAPAGGAAGTAAGSNAGGNAGTAVTATNMRMSYLTLFLFVTSGAGTASGSISGANGGAGVTGAWQGAGLGATGGTGGGTVGTNDTNFAGGSYTGQPDLYPTIAGGVAAGGAGNPGLLFQKPFRIGAGTGGGTGGPALAVGGRGGDGNIGCGGGGGGGGTTGGAGGRGGDGYVVLVSW